MTESIVGLGLGVRKLSEINFGPGKFLSGGNG